jgi:hypothetical protein
MPRYARNCSTLNRFEPIWFRHGLCSRDASASEFCSFSIRSLATSRGSGAPDGANSFGAAQQRQTLPSADAPSAAARLIAARSPSGAPPRHSPGRTHPALAQLQFPRFLRPGSTGVTRFRLSPVYRAPRRPVVMPAERWPRAARERFARPPAGTAPAPHLGSHPDASLDRAGWAGCNLISDERQGSVTFTVT